MKIDLSFKIDKEALEEISRSLAQVNLDLEKQGHIGTHFDVMNKEFSIENTITIGRVFDISHIKNGEVKVDDIDLSSVESGDSIQEY
jgi:hypothetical protein